MHLVYERCSVKPARVEVDKDGDMIATVPFVIPITAMDGIDLLRLVEGQSGIVLEIYVRENNAPRQKPKNGQLTLEDAPLEEVAPVKDDGSTAQVLCSHCHEPIATTDTFCESCKLQHDALDQQVNCAMAALNTHQRACQQCGTAGTSLCPDFITLDAECDRATEALHAFSDMALSDDAVAEDVDSEALADQSDDPDETPDESDVDEPREEIDTHLGAERAPCVAVTL